MKSQRLQASLMAAKCRSCSLPANNFSAFVASFYDFQTYLGLSTSSLYRLDLDRTSVKYGKITIEEALQPAVLREGGRSNLVQVPGELVCPFCGATGMDQEDCGVEHEHFVDAFVLPVEDE